MTGHSTQASNEKEIIGITLDPVLRPVGTLMIVVGAIWAVFWGMAVNAGTFGQPVAAVALIVLGLLATRVGKVEEES